MGDRRAKAAGLALALAVVVLGGCSGESQPAASSCHDLLGRIETPPGLEPDAPSTAGGPTGTVLFVSFRDPGSEDQNDLDFLAAVPKAPVQVSCYGMDGLPSLSAPAAAQAPQVVDDVPEGWSVSRVEQVEQTDLATDFAGNRVVVTASSDDHLDAAVRVAYQIDESIE